MKNKILELLEYNNHFNNELIKMTIDNLEKIDEPTFKLINHILNAQQVWNSRILNEKPFGIWQINPNNDLARINDENYLKSKMIVEKEPLEINIEYSNSKGIKFTNSVADILLHIVNHSTYHRGQIALNFRKSEIQPLVSDYIFYKREER